MASKTLFDHRAQQRQSASRTTAAHLYRQHVATFALVARSFARVIAQGVQAIVSRLKLLALPAGTLTTAQKLARGVDARLGKARQAAA